MTYIWSTLEHKFLRTANYCIYVYQRTNYNIAYNSMACCKLKKKKHDAVKKKQLSTEVTIKKSIEQWKCLVSKPHGAAVP